MKKTLPSGTYVPIVTPFTDQGDIDYTGFDSVLDKSLQANVEALVVLGTTGEILLE